MRLTSVVLGAGDTRNLALLLPALRELRSLRCTLHTMLDASGGALSISSLTALRDLHIRADEDGGFRILPPPSLTVA